MADVQRHARLLVPAGALALEEVPEELFLQRLAIVAVEMREVRVAVHFEPFLFRAGAQPTFEIAARVQAHAAPVPGGEQGGLDILEFRDAPAVVVVKVATAFRFAWRVGNVFGEFFLRQRFGPRHVFSRHHARFSARADSVLHASDLARMPAVEEVAEDAAVAAKLAIVVGRTLPDAQRGEVRGPQGADGPLVHRVIGNAVDADLAAAPGLRAGPFDALVEVLRLALAPDVEVARRVAGAAGVDAQTGIAVRHPFLRIDQFPVLVLVARAFQDLRRSFHKPVPKALVAFLECEALGVRAIAQDYWVAALGGRPEDIGAKNDAVVHGDRNIPIDAHSVADFFFCFHWVSVRRQRDAGRCRLTASGLVESAPM